MKPSQIILQLEDIANRIFTKEEQIMMIDLCKKQKSYNIVTENYQMFSAREGNSDVENFCEWFEETMDQPEFPDIMGIIERGK